MRANAKQLALYFRQLEALLRAGVSLAFALDDLAKQAPGAALRRASHQMARAVERGGAWSPALRVHPELFSERVVALLEAAQQSGSLPAACSILAQGAEREYEIQQEIKRETWYPKLLLFFSFLLVPLPLRIGSLEISFAAQVFLVVGGWLVWKVANWAWPLAARGEVRLWIDGFRLRLPLAGRVVRGFAIARFLRVLGETGAAGIEWSRGVELGAAACGNSAIAAQLAPVSARLRSGETLLSGLVATNELPPLCLSLLKSGEVSGQLEAQLGVAAHFLEGDAQTALHEAVQAFNMLVFLLVALKIGVQVVQFWMG